MKSEYSTMQKAGSLKRLIEKKANFWWDYTRKNKYHKNGTKTTDTREKIYNNKSFMQSFKTKWTKT